MKIINETIISINDDEFHTKNLENMKFNLRVLEDYLTDVYEVLQSADDLYNDFRIKLTNLSDKYDLEDKCDNISSDQATRIRSLSHLGYLYMDAKESDLYTMKKYLSYCVMSLYIIIGESRTRDSFSMKVSYKQPPNTLHYDVTGEAKVISFQLLFVQVMGYLFDMKSLINGLKLYVITARKQYIALGIPDRMIDITVFNHYPEMKPLKDFFVYDPELTTNSNSKETNLISTML